MQLSESLSKSVAALFTEQRFKELAALEQEYTQQCAVASPWVQQWLADQESWTQAFEFILNDVDVVEELKIKASAWSITDETLVMGDLRVWRNNHMARLICRDVLKLNTVEQTARFLSDMADVALNVALKWSSDFWAEVDGLPGLCPFSHESQKLIILAMGKHGAQELNLSSDIDLIFCFSNQGETKKGRSHEEFFSRVGRKVIHLLDTRTSDGFVFRVDMRLRPWGQSGALVSNFKALQHYYLQQGRFWERFAMVKVRPVTGAPEAAKAIMDDLRPFVYRRYVDFQAIGALRELKGKIQQEVRRQNLENDIKLGRGGIREIEFIAQVFQLIRGGQDEDLQVRGTWPALNIIDKHQLLPSDVIQELSAAYSFLRDLEHRIQGLHDQQTQMLPANQSDLERVALGMSLASVDELMSSLKIHRDCVHEHFIRLIAEESELESRATIDPFFVSWSKQIIPSEELSDPSLSAQFMAFQASDGVSKLKAVAKENLDDFIPLLWRELAKFKDGPGRFECIKPIIDAVLRRTSYFVLLAENVTAIQALVKLVPLSSWIGNLLKTKPYLLDELIDGNSLYQLPSQQELTDELRTSLLRVPEDDLERQMEVLRHFRHGRVLRAAACEVTEHLPLMKISDYLARVAEVVVEQSLALAWQQMAEKHGRPSKADGEWCDTDFGVIAYGKMGGLELSYESDLDLVFLHNAAPQGDTEGPKVISNVVFMARLGQKLIHLLSAVTPSGILYEVDTRLRPSGNSGLLVSSMSAFKKYQLDKAWTWEHQALVRARFIAGDRALKKEFDLFRAEVICLQRDQDTLKTDVIGMRKKMLDHLSSKPRQGKDSSVFDLKHDAGGIVDLEFLVQFHVLAYAHTLPGLSKWSDNVRCINSLFDAAILLADERDIWLRAYVFLRAQVHHSILSNGSTKIAKNEMPDGLIEIQKSIEKIWHQRMLVTQSSTPT